MQFTNLTKNNNIFFRIHQAGFFNRFFCLQIGIGLSTVFKKPLIPYHVYSLERLACDSSTSFAPYNPRKQVALQQTTNFFDLIDYDIGQIPFIVDYPHIETFYKDEIVIEDSLSDRYVVVEENKKLEKYFASNDKSRLILEEGQNYHFRGFTLANYSTFFFNRNYELDQALSRVKIKSQYSDLAKLMSNDIGDFYGIHVRLTDHQNQEVVEEELIRALDLFYDKPVIVLTDDPQNEIFKNKNIQFFDDLFINNYSKYFSYLDIQTEVSYSLVGALFMGNAYDFIGTNKSTFTSFIQRQINQRKDYNFKFLNYYPEDNGMPFSWIVDNTDYGPITRSISRDYREAKLREYKESRLMI